MEPPPSPPPSPENISDHFDRLPDPIILSIFNHISDIKTLIRCRSLSRRFHSLVPHSDSLLLRVDRVISSVDSVDHPHISSLMGFFKSVLSSIQDLIFPPHHNNNNNNNNSFNNNNNNNKYYSPGMILRGFENIKELEIELPTGDLRLEKRAGIRWYAEYGKTLKRCVILGFRCGGVGESDLGGGGGLKTRVVWTISALIAASARHYMVKEIVTDHKGLVRLVVKDREGEGVVVMDELGIKEFREERRENVEGEEGQNGNLESGSGSGSGLGLGSGGVWWRSNRTRVPAVWMRMRHEARLELSNGVMMEGATLVVVRPTANGGEMVEEADEGCNWDEGFGFDGVYGEAVEKLINRRSYLLEMNSF